MRAPASVTPETKTRRPSARSTDRARGRPGRRRQRVAAGARDGGVAAVERIEGDLAVPGPAAERLGLPDRQGQVGAVDHAAAPRPPRRRRGRRRRGARRPKGSRSGRRCSRRRARPASGAAAAGARRLAAAGAAAGTAAIWPRSPARPLSSAARLALSSVSMLGGERLAEARDVPPSFAPRSPTAWSRPASTFPPRPSSRRLLERSRRSPRSSRCGRPRPPPRRRAGLATARVDLVHVRPAGGKADHEAEEEEQRSADDGDESDWFGMSSLPVLGRRRCADSPARDSPSPAPAAQRKIPRLALLRPRDLHRSAQPNADPKEPQWPHPATT